MTWSIRRFFIFFFLFFVPFTAFAWNALGHMVIANIAYQQLSPSAREEVDRLFSYFQKEYPEMTSYPQIAPWPDAIRSQKIEMYTRWHYINYSFSKDGTPLKNLVDTDNAAWAVKNIEPIVKNNRANPYERARFLAFLTHIVGDMHQPLHTVSYISAQHPDGDRGGNSYVIRYKVGSSNTVNVHRLWDGGVGALESNQTMENASTMASNLASLYPKTYFGSRVNELNPESWAQEGVENAKKYVYSTPENEVPVAGYIETGKRMAEQQLVLAGYRLGVLLNQLLG